MGLLDALFQGSQGGYSGLLNSLLYPSPLNQPQQQTPQSQYDPMGNFTGVQTGGSPDPFGPPPGQAEWAKQFAPPSPFTGSAPATPVQFAGAAPTQPAPQLPPTQAAAPAPAQDMPAQMASVGGYQMPQFGSAADYTPQPQAAQPATDMSAQSRQPTQPTQQTLPTFLTDQGGLGAGLRGFMNNAHTGPIGAILGGLGSAMGMQNPAQQNLKAQFEATRQALIANGVPASQASSTAMLSVLNPEAAKTILPELLTNKEKYQIIKDDPLTGKQYGFVNDRDQTINGRPLGAQGISSGGDGSSQGVSDAIAQAKAKGATRDQLLQLVPSSYRPYVDAVLQDKALPANMGRGQARMQVMGLAHAVDSNFNEEMIPTRVAMRKDFAGEGKNGQAIGALNTVQHHADQVSDAIEGFQKAGGGSDYPILNAGKLMLANNTSFDPKLRDSAQQLKDKLNATEHEVASAYNAGHLSDHDLKTWNEIKAENLPIGQLKQKLADFVDLLNGKRDSLNHMYRNTFGEDAPAIDKAANESTTAKIHQRMPNYASGGLPPGWSVKVR